MNKKKEKNYPTFSAKRLKKEWPFSLKLARDLFKLNQDGLYSSLRDFFVYNVLEIDVEGSDSSGEEEEESYFIYCDKIIEEWGIWDISQYPDFFIKNNKVHYKETIKSKVQNSTKEELTIQIYTLDHIPYRTIICEATKFYINSFFQGSVLDCTAAGLNALSRSFVWRPVFNYLLWTTCSSSMKNMLENQIYRNRKNYEKEILETFESGFQRIKISQICLKDRLAERSFFEKRFLNVFLFSGISENKSKTLINNYFLTGSLDDILSFYQELLSRF